MMSPNGPPSSLVQRVAIYVAVFTLLVGNARAGIDLETTSPSTTSSDSAPKRVGVQLGPDVPGVVAASVRTLLGLVPGVTVVEVPHETLLHGATAGSSAVDLLLSCGSTATLRFVRDAEEPGTSPPESTRVTYRPVGADGPASVVADGTPSAPGLATELLSGGFPRGTVYACYDALESLGFAFLRPLAPHVPAALTPPTTAKTVTASPQWPVRSWHIHTQHLLEFTEVLNGFGPGGHDDEAGWRAALPPFTLFLQWMVANKQNRVEWCLLHSSSYEKFSQSPERLQRLQELTSLAHSWGLAAGVDAPIALKQQNVFSLIRSTGPTHSMDHQLEEMRGRLAWLRDAGFDFVSTESGTTEFSHGDDRSMLAWMNGSVEQAAALWDPSSAAPAKTRVFIKVHCSGGQKADHFDDPLYPGEKCDFNRLPHYAAPGLGVLPHTVQLYAVDDPAPTYKNSNFSDVHAFLRLETPRRSTVFYPETTYWVNYDINVPLFLPLYGERRLHDLRIMHHEETRGAPPMDGQNVFHSGFEWGYWLGDVVASRSAYNPAREVPLPANGADVPEWERDAFAAALGPVTRIFGPAAAGPARDLLCDIVDAQRRLLIHGEVEGRRPAQVARLNGMAYLQGWDTFAELGLKFGLMETQPAKLQLYEDDGDGGAPYQGGVGPLLGAMTATFEALEARWGALRPSVAPEALPVFDELADALGVTARRAALLAGLYAHRFDSKASADEKKHGLDAARAALHSASALVARRTALYSLPKETTTGWRPSNPTVYPMGYLWTASTLFYWERDIVRATAMDRSFIFTGKERSPCYWNMFDPAVTAVGDGAVSAAAHGLEYLLKHLPVLGWYAGCLVTDPKLRDLPVLSQA